MRRVTRSAAAKGVSPLAGIVHRRAGVARKDAALQSGNLISTKRAPRAPIKFCSPVQELHLYEFTHLDKARKLYDIILSDEGRKKYAETSFSMILQPDGNVTTFTGNGIWEVFALGQLMEGDVMDFLIEEWKNDPERNVDLTSGKKILPSPYFITVVLDYTFLGKQTKEFNVEQAAKEFRTYVRDGEDLLTTDLVMMPLYKPMVLSKEVTFGHYSLYVTNRYRNTIDILGPLPYLKKHRPSKNTYHKDCENIIIRLVQVLQAVYGQGQYNASKQPNWSVIAKRPWFVTVPFQGPNECEHYALKFAATYDGEKLIENIENNDPRVLDWKAEDLYIIVFNPRNHMLVTELPQEIQAFAPDAQ